MITTDQDSYSSRVRRNLNSILVSPEFATKPRLRKFLSYVVDHALSGGTTLKGYHIAIDAFDRAADSDPNDPYIRNIARDVRKALTELYARNPDELDLLIQVPKGSYHPQFSTLAPCETEHSSFAIEQAGNRSVATANERSQPTNSVIRPAQLKIRPSVAVIPFNYQSGPEKFRCVGEIIAENLISYLSRSPTIEVISRLTTTQFSGAEFTLADVRKQIEPNYVVSGSYMIWNDVIRVSIEIADASSDNALWADSVTLNPDSLLDNCDNFAKDIFSVINETILEEQILRSRYLPLETLDLHTLVISAVELMHRSSKRGFLCAYDMLNILKKKCPSHSLPNTYLAQWHILAVNRESGWIQNSAEQRQIAIDLCDLALTQNPRDSLALTIRGCIATNLEKLPDIGKEHYDRAISLNPNNALAYCLRAALHGFIGNGDQALRDAHRSIRLSPLDPQLYLFECSLAAAAMAAGDYNLAEKHALISYSINTKHTSNLRALIAIKVELDQMQEAKKYAAQLMKMDPEFTTASYRKKAANSIYAIGEKISDSLSLAGVP